jgi:hypothetical protein
MVSLDKVAHLAYFIPAFLPKSYLLGIHIEPIKILANSGTPLGGSQ